MILKAKGVQVAYYILYKEVAWEDPNLSIDDDRSSCQDTDSWYYHFEGVSDNVEHINGTGPEYVTAMIGNNHIKPHTLLEWDPPAQPNGDISHYVVSWRAMSDAYMNQHMGAAVCHDDISRGLDLSLGIVKGLRDQTTTPAPRAVSVLMRENGDVQTDTCPRNEGCCKCAPKATSTEFDESVESQTAFENAVHNVVFVQNCAHSHDPLRCGGKTVDDIVALANDDIGNFNSSFHSRNQPETTSNRRIRRQDNSGKLLMRELPRQRRAVITHSQTKDDFPAKVDDVGENENMTNMLESMKSDTIMENVTATSFIIKGLKHYTRYFVQVTVCQDPTAPETHCSTKRAWQYVRTKSIVDADRVDNATINVEVLNGTSDIRITWLNPLYPNGLIIAYKVKVINTAKQSTPVDQCISVSAEWSPNVEGAVFEGLNDGDYR
uniref:Fibronectin type-III domain-containing protein n=1 Tax=Angiostrongylus cantonensis TaxID=6313 RepID=A0A0K0DP51_ANGCA